VFPWKPDIFSIIQEIKYRVHQSTQIVPNFSQMNPADSILSSIYAIGLSILSFITSSLWGYLPGVRVAKLPLCGFFPQHSVTFSLLGLNIFKAPSYQSHFSILVTHTKLVLSMQTFSRLFHAG
jgi:hypothetical protein